MEGTRIIVIDCGLSDEELAQTAACCSGKPVSPATPPEE